MEITTFIWRNPASAYNWLIHTRGADRQKSTQKAPLTKHYLHLNRSKIIGLFLFFLLLLMVPQPTQAASKSEGLVVDPVLQDILLENESEIETTIYISNETNLPQEVAVSATDITQENMTGRLVFLSKNMTNYPHTLAPYIVFSKDRFIIPPESTEELQVKVHNRDSLKSGGHYAAILVTAQSGETAEKTKILPALASVLYVRKLGAISISYTLEELTPFKRLQVTLADTLSATFTNNGNSHVIPRGTIKITGWNNRILMQTTLNPDSAVIFPSTRRALKTPLQYQKKPWPLEPLTLEFSYRDHSESEFQTKTLTGLYVHPALLVSTPLLGILLVLAKWLRHRKKV